jgi:hypothetical protein
MQILEQFRRNPVSEAHVLAAGWAQGDTSRKLIDNAKAIAARRRVDPDIVVLVEVAGAARCTLCNLMKVIEGAPDLAAAHGLDAALHARAKKPLQNEGLYIPVLNLDAVSSSVGGHGGAISLRDR